MDFCLFVCFCGVNSSVLGFVLMGKLGTVGHFSLLCHQSWHLKAEVVNSEGCAKGLFSRALCFIAIVVFVQNYFHVI